MSQIETVVEDYIDVLLQDAALRLGLPPMKMNPKQWAMLINPKVYYDKHQNNLKKASYVVLHLLNAKKLTSSFSDYFYQRMKIPFRKDIVISEDDGKQTTLIVLFKKKVSRFKTNFSNHSRQLYRITISKGENESGGKGKQLKKFRSHEETLQRRRDKRSEIKRHNGRIFFMNRWIGNDDKYTKVRFSKIYDEFSFIS